MAKRMRRIKLTPGDVIEIPLGKGWFAYSRILHDCGYQPYTMAAKERPEMDVIIASGFVDVLTVGEYKSEVGAWPRIGTHPFDRDEDGWSPPVRESGMVYHHGRFRKATAEDAHLPMERRYGEESFVDYLWEKLLTPIGVVFEKPVKVEANREPVVNPLLTAMSVDRNDVAEQVELKFQDFIDDDLPPEKALRWTMRYFTEAMDDDDFVPSFWLGLASVAIKNECLTDNVRDEALKVLSSEDCWNVVETWPAESEAERQEARQLRQQALDQLRNQLMNRPVD